MPFFQLQGGLGPPDFEKMGLIAVLGTAVVVLWRAYQEKSRLLERCLKQLGEQTAMLERVPEALDRLRERLDRC